MCLIVGKDKTYSARVRFEDSASGRRVKAWKVASVRRPFGSIKESIHSIHFNSLNPWTITHNGFLVSNRSRKEMYEGDITYGSVRVKQGIHVYLNKNEAESDVEYGQVVVPVWVYERDLVAKGVHSSSYARQAVFMKVQLIDNEQKKMCNKK